jgi:hypothetical protein
MQNPTDQAEASVPTETVRESPNLNRTFTVRRKAAKRSERWYQTTSVPLPPSPQAEVIPAWKKRRLDEPLPTARDGADRETASSEDLVGSPPPPAAENDDANADLVMDTPPNAGATGATGRWTPEEDAKLTSAVAKTEKKCWGTEHRIDWIAIAPLVPGRTSKQCNQRWHNTLNSSIAPTAGRTCKWTEDEDLKLKNAVETHGGKNWVEIAALVPSRARSQCFSRWYNALKSSIEQATRRTGKWTKDEDIKLKNAVQTHGGKNWNSIAALVPGRTQKQCRNRWRIGSQQHPDS